MKYLYFLALCISLIPALYGMEEEDCYSNKKELALEISERCIINNLNQNLSCDGTTKPFIQWLLAARHRDEGPLVTCSIISQDNSEFVNKGTVKKLSEEQFKQFIQIIENDGVIYVPVCKKETINNAIIYGIFDPYFLQKWLSSDEDKS